MSRYDIAIIGTGPAGLEAAITAKARNKDIVVFGSAASSDKVRKAHTVNNYLGLPAVSGEQMQKAFLDHAKNMGVEITDKKVTLIMSMGDYFAIQSSDNEMYEADSVILASGMTSGKTYPGESEFLGRGVSYCATCDAALYKGKRCAVIASAADDEPEARFLAEMAGEVLYFPLYKGSMESSGNIRVISEKPESISGRMKADQLVTDKNKYDVDGIFVLRESIAPAQLIPGLELDGVHVKTARDMSTNIPGLFAAGDITGQPYQYIKSAGEGNAAALSAVKYIDSKK